MSDISNVETEGTGLIGLAVVSRLNVEAEIGIWGSTDLLDC
jgi:hypothetical protein